MPPLVSMTPQTDSSTPISSQLARSFSLFDVTMIGVGAMVGAGIFVLTGIAAGIAGPALILVFALNGIVTLLTAMTYAELASAIPEAGGGYLWVKQGLPGANGFLAGWMSWFAHAVAGSLYALGFGAYFELMLGGFHISMLGLSGPLLHKLLGVLVALVFIYINYRGAAETGAVGNIVTLCKLGIILLFGASGLWAILCHPEYMTKFVPFAPNGFGGILAAMGLTYIAFEGYEIIAQAGEEVVNPRRNIPRAIFWALAIVIPVYLLVAFAAIGAVEPGAGVLSWQWLGTYAEIGLARAAGQFMPFGAFLLLLGGLLSTMSALNATTFSSTRVAFAMGRDRNLPDAFASVHPRRRTPHLALMFSGALIIGMAVLLPIKDVAAAAGIMFLLLFLQVNVAVITIRRKYGSKLGYGYLAPFFPLLPIVAIVSQICLAIYLFRVSPVAWYFTVGWLGSGWLLYHFYAKRRERAVELTPAVAVRVPVWAEKRPGVLVPVANPHTSANLLSFAARVARLEQTGLTLLHVVTVPEPTPLTVSDELLDSVEPTIKRFEEQARVAGVDFELLVRVSHRPVTAILQTIEERHCRFVVMGWRKRTRGPNAVIGKNVDLIIRGSNANVIVAQQHLAPDVRRVLVPVAYPKQARLSVAIAAALTGEHPDVRIDLVHLVPPGMPQEERQRELRAFHDRLLRVGGERPSNSPLERARDQLLIEGATCNLVQYEAESVVKKLALLSHNYDAMVIGGSRHGLLVPRAFGRIPRYVAEHAKCPVVLAKMREAPYRFGLRRLVYFFRQTEQEAMIEEGEV